MNGQGTKADWRLWLKWSSHYRVWGIDPHAIEGCHPGSNADVEDMQAAIDKLHELWKEHLRKMDILNKTNVKWWNDLE